MRRNHTVSVLISLWAGCSCNLLATEIPSSGQSAPAAIYWPADSGYTNVKDLGAKGDGVADDTPAIKAAYAKKGGIYFPPGTYLVSDTLMATPKRFFIQGAGPGKTVIKLKDNAPGFGDAKEPKAVLQNWDEKIGKGNNGQAFRNSFHDLAVDVGAGNPGAIGILYFTNNQGTVSNVHIRSSDPKKVGRAGIALAQGWPGPALLRDIVIDGFDDGIWSIINQYSFTFEHVTLSNQLHAGIFNSRQMLFIRDLKSNQNGAPAILHESGALTIIDSELSGNGEAAIDSKTHVYARNIKTKGYKTAIREKDGVEKGSDITERSQPFATLFETEKRSLNLTIEETPAGDWSNSSEWKSVKAFGASGNGKQDDTDAIQKTIDSGAKVVYFPRATYRVAGTIHVRGKVELIHCMESNLNTGKGDAPVFRIEDGESKFVVIQQLEGGYGDARLMFEHASARTLALKTMIPRGGFYKNTVKGAKLFIEDVCAAPCDFGNAIVFARQLNPENMGTKVSVDGGQFWCMGLKTEKAGTALEVKNGGKAEVIGGYIYYNRGNQMPDGSHPETVVNLNSDVSIAGFGGTIKETRGGETKTGSFKGTYAGRSATK
ncbi:MAG: glycosyl hydrolase family 28-related protein [Planctomycetota bacterium]